MDEAEKYQQRLQAIAEKRRLQEEQERARRDMEDEKLRLQQLKRKSLRDQWLMEAPPLSPSSSTGSQSPRSPLWGPQAQEIEQRIDQLQTESRRLADEEEKLTEQMEDGQTEAAAVADGISEAAQGAIVENGQAGDKAEAADEEVVKKLSPLLDDDAAALTNGRGEGEGEASPEDGRPCANGPVAMTFLGFSEAEPGEVPLNGEEEEGTIVMRAERVIVTDEGDDAADERSPRGEGAEEEEGAAPKPEVPEASAEAGEEKEKEAAAADAAPGEGETNGGGGGGGGGEGETDGAVTPSSLADAPVASVPVYSEAPAALILAPAEGGAEEKEEEKVEQQGGDAPPAAQTEALLPGPEFQEVSLAEPRTEASALAEQEPLLSPSKDPQTPAGAPGGTTAPAETLAPAGGQGGGDAPKRKTCQCCSVM